MEQFHFVAPEWFLAIIPAVAVFLLLRRRHDRRSSWELEVEGRLLPFLLEQRDAPGRRHPFWLLLLAWMVVILALAGPVWVQRPQPIHERQDAMVVVFDLSLSMHATDLKPSRLVHARQKLLDILAARTEGVTGLIVFAGSAHSVSPLTDDSGTIAAMVPALSPEIMPRPGSELAPALAMALQLFANGDVDVGRILVITDEITDADDAIELADPRFPVSVLAVGTGAGGPISLAPGQPDAGFLRNDDGVIVIPGVDAPALHGFAASAGGDYHQLSVGDEDVADLATTRQFDDVYLTAERDFDAWVEEGPWLLLLLLPLASFAFRRGWIWCLAAFILLPPEEGFAASYANLWLNADQQGAEAFAAGDPARAARLFEDPAWQGSAYYRDGDFASAAQSFDRVATADGRYNLGNALAKQGLLDAAIQAYDQALALDPALEDARFNRRLVKRLLEKRQQPGQGESDQREGDGEPAEEPDQPQTGSSPDPDEGERDHDAEGGDPEESPAPTAEPSPVRPLLNAEDQQALEQWLRRIPNDPGGLLASKFRMQHRERSRVNPRPLPTQPW